MAEPRPRRYWIVASTLGTVSLVAIMAASPALAQNVGTAGAVNPAAQGTRGAATRTINLGNEIVFRERIQTQATGSVQVVFVDRSTLMVGPNSDVVIDEFVFDPNSGTGRMAVSMARGSMRFLGGQISRTNGAEFRTPVATIGVRGTAAQISFNPQTRQLSAVNISGTMTMRLPGSGETRSVTQPGFAMRVSGGGGGGQGGGTGGGQGQQGGGTTGTIQVARAAPSDFTSNPTGITNTAALTGGGAPVRPTDAAVQSSPVGQTTQATAPVAVVPRQTASGTTTGDGDRPATALLTGGSSTSNETTQAATQGAATQTAQTVSPPPPAPPPPPPPPPAPPPRTFSQQPFALVSTATSNGGSPVPFVLGSFIASGPVTVTPIMGHRTFVSQTTGGEVSRTLQTGFQLNTTTDSSGIITAQSSFLSTVTADFVARPGATGDLANTYSGGLVAFTRRAINLSSGRSSAAVSNIPGTLAVDSDLLPTTAQVNQNSIIGTTLFADTGRQNPGGGSGTTDYFFQETITRQTPPAGLGTSRPSITMTGYAAGTIRSLTSPTGAPGTFTFTGPAQRIGSPGGAGTMSLQLNPNNSTGFANVSLSNLDASGQVFQNAVMQFGINPNVPNSRTRSAYIDRDTWALRGAAADASPGSQETVPTSRTNNVVVYASHMQMVPWSTIAQGTPAPALPNSVVPVTSPYAQWGFWSAENTHRPTGGPNEQSERTGLNTWVVGQLSASAQVPLAGSATFTGHAVATMRDAANEFVGASTFSQNVNFATNAVTFSAPNLHGFAFSGSGTISGTDRSRFSGTFNGPGPSGITGTAVGMFYGPAANASGGQISFTNTSGTFRGAGIFMATRP